MDIDEIKVGEYVRTDDGLLFKADEYWYYECLPKLDNDTKSKLTKHSPNIIDLIEENDYVNGRLVEEICEYDEDGNDKYELGVGEIDCEDGYYIPLKAIEIKNIVTHQQFNSIKYEVN